jgi:hypothetical protein
LRCHTLQYVKLNAMGKFGKRPALRVTGAAGRATLLAVPVSKISAFPGDAVDVGRLVAHYALVVGTDIEAADVVTPDDEDVGLFGRRIRRAQRSKGNNQAHTNSKTCCYKPIDQTHCLTSP